MKVVSDLSDAALASPCVLSIGNFDGLHRGHDRILKTVVEHSHNLGISSAIMTFDPHPLKVLAAEKAPKLITTLEQKLRLIESRGIDLAFVASFSSEFSALSPENFISRYLVNGLHARAICVGNNFTFGKGQAGTTATLRHRPGEFEVLEIDPVLVRGLIASSTHVRRFIREGRVSRACRLLGRWFEIEGRIVAGEGRGRTVTVPTLNMETENELLPGNGVYITRVSLDGGAFADSLTNIGVRPTFAGNSLSIETFVLDAVVPANKRTARLQFLRRVRDERRFDSSDLLRQQIGRDVKAASRFFRMLQRGVRNPSHSH